MIVTIRRAEAADAATLTAIALDAKRHWGYPEEWIVLWTPSLTITPAFISAHDVFVAARGGQMAGFYSLVSARARWELDHLYVGPAHMGRGIGRRLFRHAAERMRELAPDAPFRIEADPNAESFYVRMGAKRVGEVSRDWQGLTRVLPLLEFSVSRVSLQLQDWRIAELQEGK